MNRAGGAPRGSDLGPHPRWLTRSRTCRSLLFQREVNAWPPSLGRGLPTSAEGRKCGLCLRRVVDTGFPMSVSRGSHVQTSSRVDESIVCSDIVAAPAPDLHRRL